MQQNHVPVVKEITISNATDVTLENLKLKLLFEPDFAKTWETNIESISPDRAITLNTINIVTSTKMLSELTERMLGSIRLEISSEEEILFTQNYEISILAFDQWGGLLVLPEMLAAFVTPNHPAILPVIKRASEILEKWTGSPSLDEYQTRDPNRVKKQMAAIYEALSEQQITYSSVPASFEEYGQRVRLCDNIFKNKLANCLDMALLYAGCLEAAGIHPMLVIIQGHAFAGGWLINDSFTDSVNDDISLLTKRTATGINEILLVETTCMNSGPVIAFDEAANAADYKLNNTDNFLLFIDVKRSRFAGIRPLPLRITSENGILQLIEEKPITERQTEAPTSLSATNTIIETDKIEVNKQRIWERKLLDLSLRNSLLNIRITKNTLQLISVQANELEDALADGAEFQVLSKPKDWDNPLLSTGIYQSLHASDPIIDLVKQELTQKRLRSYQSEIDLQKTLTHLYRSSRLSLEENGANTLYLALGLLKWFETPTSTRPRYAPLLLLPIEIIRKSALKGYVIRSRDEDTMMNITLLEMLRQDFGINISGLENLPRDGSGIDVPTVFNTIRRGIMTLARWDVEEQAIIGNFSFNKFIMWNDIHNNADKLRENKIVASLMSGQVEWKEEEEEENESDENLDDKFSVGDIALPISADSSQLEAIYAAVDNKSFILHGPPGTGKSQTITNIIANALYNGKKVLFVAEKMAALSVVQKRLEAIGLAPFCLELHSNKAKKSVIFEQLKRTTEVVKGKSVDEFRFEAGQINKLREEINDYVKALHKPHRAGLSLYDSFSAYASLESAQDTLTFEPELMHNLTYSTRREFEDAVKEYEAICQICGTPRNHPFRNAELTNFSISLKGKVQQLLDILSDALKDYEKTLNTLLDLLDYHPDSIFKKQFESLLRITERLHQETTLPHELIKADSPDSVVAEIDDICSHNRKREILRITILKDFDKEILSIDTESYHSQWDELLQWFQPLSNPQTDIPLIDIDTNKWKVLSDLSDTYKEYKFHINKFIDIVGCKQCVIDKKSKFEALTGMASDLMHASVLPLGMLKVTNLSETIESIKELIGHGIKRNEIRTTILRDYDKNILTANAGLWKRQWLQESDKWFLPKYLGQRKIIKQVNQNALPGFKTEPETLTELFDTLITYQEEQAIIDNQSADISPILGTLWNHGECDWKKLEKAVDTITNLQTHLIQLTQDTVSARQARLSLAAHLSDGITTFKDLQDETLTHLTERSKLLYDRFCTVKAALKDINTAGDPVKELFNKITSFQTEQQYIKKQTTLFEPILGKSLWNNGEGDWKEIERASETLSILNENLLQLEADPSKRKQIRHSLAAKLENGIVVFKNKNDLNLDHFINEYNEIQLNFKSLQDLLDIHTVPQKEGDWLNDLLVQIQIWNNHIDSLRDKVTYNIQKKRLLESGLEEVVYTVEKGDIDLNRITDTYKKGLYRSYAEYILSKEPQLNTFNGKLFEEKIAKFRNMCQFFEKLTKDELYARLASNLPYLQKEASQSSEVGILQRNIRNGGRGMSLRKLFDSIPDLLTRICPCMLMSPISVAQYMDAGNVRFDLIVFDEASQMPTCEAAGVIARGKNVIVVGDPKQMPPTNFFNTNSIDEDNIEKEDLESILDDCLALTMPSKHLLWHYRSKHESLIAFSNAKYYENSLLTFPSPDDITTKVNFEYVEGFYDRGKSRQNEGEAKAIIEEIKRRLDDDKLSKYSIGVVTFNTNQQSLIEDLLNELFQTYPQLEAKALECEEPIFIKNLENVQGDERDIILFSVGYGPDKENKITLNFGPLNRDGGWRRLNVAVSRARYEMKVYSTLRADQIDLNRTSAEGVAGLRAFLEYAEKGKSALSITKTTASRDEDGLVNIIAGVLRSKGYDVQTNVGCSGYRIDIGVVNPNEPSKYILGILCDGYNYNTAKSARDREINQTAVLKLLGWRLYHLWSMDWWENREKTIDALIIAIEDVIAGKPLQNEKITNPAMTFNSSYKVNSSTDYSMPKKPDKKSILFDSPYAKPYALTYLPSMDVSSDILLYGSFESDTIKRIQEVVSTEAPISKSLLSRKVIYSYRISRLGTRIMSYMDQIFHKISLQTTGAGEDTFYWHESQNPEKYTFYRPVSERDATDISPEEVSNAVRTVLEEQFSLPEEDLIRETAHIFGFTRLGDNVVASMSRGIKKAYERGFLINENGKVKIQ